ncbi:hypothetical protein FOCC_FOCC014448 [Frankliniella occidentalis]|nr:hypothetical protein FOCC_FOCC014448 [Frankliniella occidentalis]
MAINPGQYDERIGRQHLVSYQKTNKGITVSSCYFDGTTPSSAYCDGKQFWIWLFWGTHDEITLINNHVANTAGRTPHAGGWSKSRCSALSHRPTERPPSPRQHHAVHTCPRPVHSASGSLHMEPELHHQARKTVKPKNTAELTNYLKSGEKLIIDLTTTFDYTKSEGTAVSTGCFFLKCGSGFQESLANAGTCNGRSPTKVTYYKAGLTQLIVGSNKSIISSNGKGAIKGKGLRIKNAKNVIIQGITISDINPHVIWAGDALSFDNVENVWVHKCTIANYVHLVGNSMDNNKHGGIEPWTGSYILSEGNKWTSFTRPINIHAKGGHLAMVNDANGASQCKKYLGAKCLVNKYDNKSKSKTWFDVVVLSQFSKLDKRAISSARNAVCV